MRSVHDDDADADYCFILLLLLLLFIRTRRRRRNTFSERLRWYIEHAHNTPDLEERRNTLTRELQSALYMGKPSPNARTAMALKEKKK